jgi:hypothetical protein
VLIPFSLMPLINDWEVPLLFEGDKEFFAKSFRTLSNDLNKQMYFSGPGFVEAYLNGK